MQSFHPYRYLYEWGRTHTRQRPQNDMDLEALIERAKAKDPNALDTLYRRHYPKMLRLCVKMTKEDEDTAKDLVHDAFVLAFTSLHTLNNPKRFGEWLATIVRNVTLKYLERKEKTRFISITEDNGESAGGNSSTEATVNQQDILNLVDKLPNGYGKVFRLYVIDGFSHKEIADILGIEPHSSSSQLSRAKAMLRKMIGQRHWVIVMLMILAIPLYLFISRERPVAQKSKMAEADSRKKDKDGNKAWENDAENTEKATHNGKPVKKRMIASNVATEISDTVLINDTIGIEPNVSERQTAENRQPTKNKHDGTERTDSILPQFNLPDLTDIESKTTVTKKKTKKWQMLAAGSLGPALAQNIYRLLTTNNPGDIESGDPAATKSVSNWEDYSRYLNTLKNNNMPKDSLALIEIANNNQGDIIEQEQHDRPVTFGVSLSKQLSEKWSIETGLQYSILKSRSIIGNREHHISKNQKIDYLGIPLQLSFHIADYKRLSAYGSAGVSLHIPIYNKVTSKLVVANVPMDSTSTRIPITPPAQWSTSLSVGLQYRVLPKLALYIEPSLYWYIPNGSSTHTVWTERTVIFSVPFGIRFTW